MRLEGREERSRHISELSQHQEEHGDNREDESEQVYTSSSRRYNYRSRSDVNQDKRYASQTLLDGNRPGPIASSSRRDALHTLQRELDSLSRSPDGRGYASDYGHDTIRSRGGQRVGQGFSNYEYGNEESKFEAFQVSKF